MNDYRAMVIPEPGAALVAIQREIPAPADSEVLIEVSTNSRIGAPVAGFITALHTYFAIGGIT